MSKQGLIAGFACYFVWGILSIYWKSLDEVNSYEIIAHRILWCCVVTFVMCKLLHIDVLSLFKQKRAWFILVPAGFLCALNWGLYIVAVNANHIIECSMGSYLNPLVNMLFGVLFFRERLSVVEIIAIALCGVGILYFTVDYGSFPLIAIVLAVTFGLYGALKKKGAYPPVSAIAFESFSVTPIALVILVFMAQQGTLTFLSSFSTPHDILVNVMLLGAGAVTAFPLILFARAANSIPLTTLGFLQYISPTIQLGIGVFLFGEQFSTAHAVCMTCIWIGLALVALHSLRRSRTRSVV